MATKARSAVHKGARGSAVMGTKGRSGTSAASTAGRKPPTVGKGGGKKGPRTQNVTKGSSKVGQSVKGGGPGGIGAYKY
jgi:hypothetical protein